MPIVDRAAVLIFEQVRAIDHLIDKYSFLLINQFIQREKLLFECGCCAVSNGAGTDLFYAVPLYLKINSST